LVERDLAERRRDAGDARQTFVGLTERGREVVQKVKLKRQAKLERALQEIGDEKAIVEFTKLLEEFTTQSVQDSQDALEVKLETGF
jgi:DNA-binding MarR family transcriptional regulator